MAVAIVASNIRKENQGSNRVHTGTLTSGSGDTYLTSGFTVTAAQLGLHSIRSLQITAWQNATPLVFQGRVVIADTKNGSSSATVFLYGTNATPGAAVADPQV